MWNPLQSESKIDCQPCWDAPDPLLWEETETGQEDAFSATITIQGQKFDIEDKDIVIGMLQSLSQKTYDMKAFESFGLSVYDECHHLSAEVFSNAMVKIVTKYTLGLSQHILPAKIPNLIYENCKKFAKIAHDKHGCKAISRSDFIYDNNKLYFLEF